MTGRRYLPLEAYGLVGDGRSAALVGRDGSVDWWCPPRFDAPSVFGRLLDDRIGGFCSLAPAGSVHASPLWESSQRYRPGTNVLDTEFRGADARLRVTDVMPWPGPARDGRDGGSGPADGGHGRGGDGRPAPPPRLLRRAEARGGPVEAELRFAPRFDYARGEPAYAERPAGYRAEGPGGELLSVAGPGEGGDGLPLEVDGRRGEVTARFRVEPGEPRWIALRWGRGPRPVDPAAARGALESTAARWRERADAVPVRGELREAAVRSALLLDLLTHRATGAVAASATTSLPGAAPPADGRRLPAAGPDATEVLAALQGLGRRRESARLARALSGGLAGDPAGAGAGAAGSRTAAPEGPAAEPRELDHLHGHGGHRPVLVGPGLGAPPAGDAAGGDGPGGSAGGGPRGDGALRSLAAALRAARERARAGEAGGAADRIRRALASAGPTGLLAEAVDPESGRLRGNHPSAVAHAALLRACLALEGRGAGVGSAQKDQ